jgi:hypothetical protein
MIRRGLALIALSVVIALGIYAVTHLARRPTPLPPKLAHQVERHEIATAVDTAEIHRLTLARDREEAARRRAESTAARMDSAAQLAHARADSFAAAAAVAQTVSDSAEKWRAAYGARTAEADTLRRENQVLHAALDHARFQIAAVDSALARSQGRAARADSVIAAAVTVVRASDPPCRFAYVFSCPSRTTVAAITAVLAATGGAVIEHEKERRDRKD